MGPGSRSLRSLGRDDNLSGTALVWPADATSILQHVLQRRDHAQGLVDLLLLLDAGDVVAPEDLEHALVGAAADADAAAGLRSEERRGGQGCVRTCRSRWCADAKKHKSK